MEMVPTVGNLTLLVDDQMLIEIESMGNFKDPKALGQGTIVVIDPKVTVHLPKLEE
jgi:hypothetical protein